MTLCVGCGRESKGNNDQDKGVEGEHLLKKRFFRRKLEKVGGGGGSVLPKERGRKYIDDSVGPCPILKEMTDFTRTSVIRS